MINHLTIDGLPLCEFGAIAYRERLIAAGMPCCDWAGVTDQRVKQLKALALQFPNRVALVMRACPNSRVKS